MLRKRIKKNTLKWKKIYAEQLLDMMDEEENALQKIYLTGYVLELKKNRYFAGWYKDRIVCRSLEYARYFPSAEAAEEYVHKYLGFAGMTCYVCHVNWTLASCGSENMEDNEENLLEENGKILSFANYADVKQYRKKDLDILKLLVKLTGTNAKNADAVLEKRMRMFGYSDKETAFLNFVLMYFVERPDRISLSGLTAEKIGLNVLEAFLPGKETYPEEAYVLCSRILRTYGKLSVRIDGRERLEKCMNETFRVENVKTFLTLFPFRSNEPEEWHYIDLTEEKWDPLVKELSSEEFEACVTDTLKGKTYSTKSLLKYLERYENLTGSRYQDVFWKKSERELYAVFNRLILHGILDGKKYLEEFVKDYKNEEPDLEKKWEFMAGYLKSEIKGLCNEHSYPMLKFLINEIGMDGCEFLSPWRILKETFSLGYYAIQHRECEFFSPVLGKEEHRELFSIVEKKFFYEYPDIYPEYLTALLLKESTALWLEQSEAYELSKLLLPFISDSYRRETLYQKYMTEEDRKRYQERKEWLKEQKKRIDHWKTEKNIKQQFNQILRENRKTDKEIQSIYEFYKNGQYSYGHKKLYCKIVSSYLKDNFAGTAKKLMAKKEALYLLKLAENMYQDECMGLPEITELIERAEVA